MNRRTLKKHCQRAVPILIAQHGYAAASFHPSDGQEAMDAPLAMERQFVRNGFLEPGPLKGTPLLWERTSYECEEWESRLPSEVLSDLEFWASLSDEDYRRLAYGEAA